MKFICDHNPAATTITTDTKYNSTTVTIMQQMKSTMKSFLLTALLASSVIATAESTKLEHGQLRGESTSAVATSTRALQGDEEYLDAVQNREEYQELLNNTPNQRLNHYFHRIVGGNQVDRDNNPYSYYVEMGGCGVSNPKLCLDVLYVPSVLFLTFFFLLRFCFRVP